MNKTESTKSNNPIKTGKSTKIVRHSSVSSFKDSDFSMKTPPPPPVKKKK